MSIRWVISGGAWLLAAGAAAYLAFVAHQRWAFWLLWLLVLVVLARLHLAYLAWLSRPGGRSTKVLVAGGPYAWLHDRGRGTSAIVRLLLGGPDLLLVRDEDDEA